MSNFLHSGSLALIGAIWLAMRKQMELGEAPGLGGRGGGLGNCEDQEEVRFEIHHLVS